MTSSKLRVAVVGAGGWGREHARAFSQRGDVELCAIVDRRLEAARIHSEEFGGKAYIDVEPMLDAEKPDFVSLAVSNLHQVEPTQKLIRAHVPLLVEKPLAFTLQDADMLLKEAQDRNVFFAIDFNHRYARPVQVAREAIVAGKLGNIIFGIWRFGGEPSPTAHPHANLIETQCHGFDMLEYLCGPIASVMVEMTDKTGGGYRTLVVALRFASGAVGSMVGTYDSSYEYPNASYLEVNGSCAHVVVEDTVRRLTLQERGSDRREVYEAGYYNDESRSFRKLIDRHLDEVLAAFRAGKEPPVHARAGRRALALAVASIESFERGVRVTTL